MSGLFEELVVMGTLVLIAGCVLHQLALKHGWHDESDTDDEDDDNAPDHPILKKWYDFGGGYYGTVAFVKLLLIEFSQLKGFVADWQGFDQLAQQSPIALLVAFFTEQIQNFVAAIIWPTDYLSSFTIWQCAIFVAVTYGVYEASRLFVERNR